MNLNVILEIEEEIQHFVKVYHTNILEFKPVGEKLKMLLQSAKRITDLSERQG